MNNKLLLGLVALILVVSAGGLGFFVASQYNQGGETVFTEMPITTTPTPVSTEVLVTPIGTNIAIPTTSTPDQSHQVKVFLFNNTLFNTPSNTVYWSSVNRTTTRQDVAAFAVEEIIKGPTYDETTQGYGQTFGSGKFALFVDDSNCQGKDFTVSISAGTATVAFCRGIILSGDMSGYVVTGEIAATLKQFSTIQKVVVLNKQGQCFDDMSGQSDITKCVY